MKNNSWHRVAKVAQPAMDDERLDTSCGSTLILQAGNLLDGGKIASTIAQTIQSQGKIGTLPPRSTACLEDLIF